MGSTYPAPITRIEGETLALTTSRASLSLPRSHHQLTIYAPAQDIRVHLNPALIDAVYYDASNSAGAQYEKASGAGVSLHSDLTDRLELDKGTGTALDLAQTDDFLYLCFSDVIGGINVDMTSSVNADTSSTLAATYRKNDDTWANLSPTDGTVTSGRTLAKDGEITWTAPSDWKAAQLIGNDANAIVSNTTTTEPSTAYGFWLRLAFGTALPADVEIDNIWALNKDTNRGYFQKETEYSFSIDRRSVGAIEVATTSSTDTLRLTYIRTIQ